MSSLPAPAVATLEQAREWAEFHHELAAAEEQNWRFSQNADGRIFIAERHETTLYAGSVKELLAHIAGRRHRGERPRNHNPNEGEPSV